MKPFRWSIAKREQLGSLIDGIAARDLDHDGFLNDIRTAAARVLAFANDADLAFIGRTPENFYDYLSGVFAETGNAPTLHLIHFSLRWAGEGGIDAIHTDKLNGFFNTLRADNIDAASIARAERPLAFVDFVAAGGTMENFIKLLRLQSDQDGIDWNAVQRRLMIIGLTVRKHNSPNTWRWQQHQDWLDLIPDARIKNVSAPAHLLWHLANDQAKVTHSHHPGLWDRDVSRPDDVTDIQREALALAVKLYDRGHHRTERLSLAAELSSMREMRQAATRQLVLQLKR